MYTVFVKQHNWRQITYNLGVCSTDGISVQWHVMAVSMLLEAGTWTLWWRQTPAPPSTLLWSAITPGRIHGGWSTNHVLQTTTEVSWEHVENSIPFEVFVPSLIWFVLGIGNHLGWYIYNQSSAPLFRFVSSLPMTDFLFSMSLSHDVPLASSLGHFLYVLGNIQRTGEKLVLQYNTRKGTL